MKQYIEKMKSYYASNKQKVTLFGSVALVMLVIILAIAIAVKIIGSRLSYEGLETRLESAAEKYLRDNPNELPSQLNPTVVVNADILVENKYIKEIQKLVKDSSCSANIIVDYVNSNYKYQAYVTCNKFKTEKFIDTIKNNNKISQVGEGLYEMNNELVFRGQNPNNYVKLGEDIFRIVKIDKKGNIQIILTEWDDKDYDTYDVWDDRYNSERESNYGINNYSLSRALVFTKNLYELKYKNLNELFVPFDLCVGKRAENSTDKSGNMECSELITNQNIGLLPVYDFMNASLDGLCQTTISRECQNYNYLVNEDYNWWTLTADLQSTYSVFRVRATGVIESDYASSKSELRYVLSLSSDALYKSGTGTYEDPYEIR